MTRTLRIEPRGELFVVIVNGMERPCSSLGEALAKKKAAA